MKQNRTQQLYNLLKNDILNGELLEGSQLSPCFLKEKYKVSLSVAREALILLITDGLVLQKPNKGFFCIKLSSEYLLNIIECRKINEIYALEKAMDLGDLQWESEIIAAYHKLEYYTKNFSDENFNKWREAHTLFHYNLIKGCQNKLLISLCQKLWTISELYRTYSIKKNPNRNSLKEHKDILDAVLKRDKNLVKSLYIKHITYTLEKLT